MTSWERFVDLVAVAWLLLFILGYAAPGLKEVTDPALTGLTTVFVLDLIHVYEEVGSLTALVRRRWLDIVLLIPFFRLLRVFRVARVARAAGALRAVKATRSTGSMRAVRAVKGAGASIDYAEKAHQAMKFIKKIKRILRLLGQRA